MRAAVDAASGGQIVVGSRRPGCRVCGCHRPGAPACVTRWRGRKQGRPATDLAKRARQVRPDRTCRMVGDLCTRCIRGGAGPTSFQLGELARVRARLDEGATLRLLQGRPSDGRAVLAWTDAYTGRPRSMVLDVRGRDVLPEPPDPIIVAQRRRARVEAQRSLAYELGLVDTDGPAARGRNRRAPLAA